MKWCPRFRAFMIHLSASVLLASLAIGLVLCVWYPAPLHVAVGVSSIVLLVIGVDVVIGPLLTLVVYKEGKKSLRFDLATIVLLQLAALTYGLWTVAEGRPAWLVYTVDRFDLVQVYQLDRRRLEQARPDYRQPSWFGPDWVSAKAPMDIERRNEITFEAALAGIDIPQRPDLYTPLAEASAEIKSHAIPLDRLEQFNSKDKVLAVRARWPEADAFLPMMSKVHPVTVLIRKESGQVVSIVDLNPW